jgi:predicted enzyme related to lactoylglutathione lyase
MIGKPLLLLCVSCLVFIPLKSHNADEAGTNQFPASDNREQASKPSGKESVQQQSQTNQKEQRMDLGNFSVSLAVKDIEASKAFYEKFGFKVFMGDAAQKWLIMKNGDHVIGLFQGMFEKNILTFNPGWDSNAQNLSAFTDVRELQRQLKAKGVKLLQEANENSTGPASFMAVDPDGNQILVDQHR